MNHCDHIDSLSIRYTDNQLGKRERIGFIKHIGHCSGCRERFLLVSSNYDAYDAANPGYFDFGVLKRSVMSRINRPAYAWKPVRIKPKLVTAIIAVLAFCSITAFAEPIYKSLEGLLETIAIRNESLLGLQKKTPAEAEKTRQNWSDADALFDKYRDRVDETADSMVPGEVRAMTFEGEREDFYVVIGKGTATRSLIYGLKGENGIRYKGDIPTNYLASVEESSLSLEQLADQGYFVPIPAKLPENYVFESARLKKGDIDAIQFNKGNNSYLTIGLATDRVTIMEDSRKSLETVNGMQAVYCETEFSGYKYGKLHVYLGEDKRLKVMTISTRLSDGIGSKDKLMEIAESIEFRNSGNNLITTGGYFKDVRESIPVEKLDEFYELVKKGAGNIEILIEEDVYLRRSTGSGKRETYYIDCTGGDISKIGRYSNHPLLINPAVLEKNILENFCIIGQGYKGYKDVNFTIINPDSKKKDQVTIFDTLHVNTRVLDPRTIQYPAFDIVINDYAQSSDFISSKSLLIFDRNNHPYIVTGAKNIQPDGNETVYGRYFRTVKEVNSKYVQYNIIIPYEMMEGMSDKEFIDQLEFIW